MSKTRLSVWLAMGAVLCGCGDSGAGGTTIGPAGPVGPAGPEGKSGNQAPALTLFTPQVAFAGRTVSVQISGGGTAFTGSEVIDFADVAINTDSVSAGSVSNLRASVSIGPSAQVGPHDVTVVSGTDVFKLAGGFTVAASLKPNTLTAPSVGQGGLIPYDVLNVDYQASPFSSGFRLNGGLHTVSQTSLSATRTVGMGLADALDDVGDRLGQPRRGLEQVGVEVVVREVPGERAAERVGRERRERREVDGARVDRRLVTEQLAPTRRGDEARHEVGEVPGIDRHAEHEGPRGHAGAEVSRGPRERQKRALDEVVEVSAEASSARQEVADAYKPVDEIWKKLGRPAS